MAERTNAFAEATGRTTTSSTTVGGTNKLRLTHTPGDNERWWYWWDAQLDQDHTTLDVLARLRNSTAGVDWGNINLEPHDTTDRIRAFGIKEHTYGASPGPQNIDIDFWVESGVASVGGAGEAHIFGLKANTGDKSAATDADNTNTSATWETAAMLTETLSGDYLFSACEYNITGLSAYIGIRADKAVRIRRNARRPFGRSHVPVLGHNIQAHRPVRLSDRHD
jgi:hypothetical protein